MIANKKNSKDSNPNNSQIVNLNNSALNSEKDSNLEMRNSLTNLNLQSRPRDDEQFEFEVDKFTF